MRSYLELLTSPATRGLVLAAVLSRLSTSMLGLTLALAAGRLHGSVVDAGLVITAHATALATLAPLAGRLTDGRGARSVLRAYLSAHLVAYVCVLVMLTAAAPVPLLGLGALMLGATTPPAASVIRAHWPSVVPPDQVRSAYALDSVSNSAMFVAGPPLAGLIVALHSPTLALAGAAVAKLVGDGLLVIKIGRSPGDRIEPSRRPGSRRLFGPLSDARVRLLLSISALDTFGYACLFLAAVDIGLRHNPIAGSLMGILAAGEVIGGIGYGARRWPGALRAQLIALHLATAAVLVFTLSASAVPLLVLFFLSAGIASGARDALNQMMLSHSAPSTARTETFAWLNTFMWGGFAIGNAAGALAYQIDGGRGILLLAVAIALLAAGSASRVTDVTVKASEDSST